MLPCGQSGSWRRRRRGVCHGSSVDVICMSFGNIVSTLLLSTVSLAVYFKFGLRRTNRKPLCCGGTMDTSKFAANATTRLPLVENTLIVGSYCAKSSMLATIRSRPCRGLVQIECTFCSYGETTYNCTNLAH